VTSLDGAFTKAMCNRELSGLLDAEFIEMIADSDAGLYACQESVDMFGLTLEDFVPQVKHIITVGEFHGLAAGGQIIFT
jgi:peroxiredoxin family protein